MTSNKIKPYLALATTSILWGSTWVASKYAIGDLNLPALQLSYIRQFLAGALFLIYFLIIKKAALPTRKDMGHILMMSVLMFLFANGLSTWGLKYLPTGLASLLGATYPLCVVAIEWIFYKKRNVKPLTFLGLFLGLGGVALVFYENMFTHADEHLYFGLALSVFALISWSLGTIFLARHELSINPNHGMGWQLMIGSFMVYIMAHFTKQEVPIRSIDLKGWLSILYLVIAGSVISFIAFIYTLQTLPATVASSYAYFNPIVAMLIAFVWLKEELTAEIIIGAVITLIGVYIVNHSTKHNTQKIITESEI